MREEKIVDAVLALCCQDDLATYDPYDVWRMPLGRRVKSLFNESRIMGYGPAALLTIVDLFGNSFIRSMCAPQEYPIVRALAAQALTNVSVYTGEKAALDYSKRHIDWLLANSRSGYSGLSWGLGFDWPVSKGLTYSKNTPFTTHTPYVLEAMHLYMVHTGSDEFRSAVRQVFDHYERDVCVIVDTPDEMAVSYGPMNDRVVTNAIAYTLHAYAIFSVYLPERSEYISCKITRLYNFLKRTQMSNGAWMYDPYSARSFIDCFHSCFVMKNIAKARHFQELDGAQSVIEKGFRYLIDNFLDERTGLVRRFSVSNKPSVVKYDLYDNAEFISLARLLGHSDLVDASIRSVEASFRSGGSLYSMIDILGVRRNRECLRWAVMPYVHALSTCLVRC